MGKAEYPGVVETFDSTTKPIYTHVSTYYLHTYLTLMFYIMNHPVKMVSVSQKLFDFDRENFFLSFLFLSLSARDLSIFSVSLHFQSFLSHPTQKKREKN